MASFLTLLLTLIVLSVGDQALGQLSTVQVSQESYYIEIPEEQPNGTQVVNVEAFYFTSTGRRQIDGQFSIPNNGDARFFTLESTTTRTSSVGIIQTAALLDRDAPNVQTRFQFDVTYTAPDGATDRAQVDIQLTDVNDNAPQFTDEVFNVLLFEQTPGGTPFFNVTAVDIDQVILEIVQEEISPMVFDLVERYTVSNGRIIFTITSGNELNHFMVNEDNGTLSISPGITLDVDLIDTYNLTIMAVDGGGLNDTATVVINVLDSNDNAPQILGPFGVDIALSEDTEVGYVILEGINATDEDSGPNADIRFLILSGDMTNSFSIDELTGEIVVSSPLDRERGAIVNLTVAARDRGVPAPLQNTIQVVVRLVDVNDYIPTFSQDFYTFTVNENSRLNTRVAQLTATDLDEGVNGTLNYSIIDSGEGIFYIDPLSGEIFTNSSLDREEVSFYSFLVEAADNPDNSSLQLSSLANITILVGDLNDNPPIFDQRSYEMSILDSIQRNDEIIQVRATDRDSGTNGDVVYSIFEQDPDNPNALRINSETGVVYRFRRIRFEDQSVFRVILRATDGGGIHDSIPLTVYVHNVNENPPSFEQSHYNTTVFETTPIGTVVLNVSAPDPDIGLIGEVRYRVISEFDEAGSFEVNETTGDVYINSTLDFDFRDFVSFQIEAYDGGFPEPFTDVTNVTIFLLPENDEAPSIIFPEGFRPTVPEHEEPGIEIVALVNYTFDPDFDEGGEFTFALVEIYDALAENDSFSFNETTGLLTSLRTFDRELQPEGIVVAIETIDFGTPQQSKVTNITIFIGDKNDQAPYFESNISTTTYELMPPGTLVLDDYLALDDDIGTNAQLEYAIFDGEGSERFMIDAQSGHIFTAEVLDKEMQRFYNLTILVVDSGIPQMYGFGAVYIEVLDSNDMIPIFSEQTYNANFSEADPPGTPVLQVNATDMDIGTNAEIEYYFAPNSSLAERFFLNSTTGELFTDDIFDREMEEPFNLTIIAVDSGLVPAPLTGSTTVLVTLLDDNDNQPYFNETLYTADVIENAVNGTYLTTVLAFDNDTERPNNVVRYSLRGNRSEDFYVDPIIGDVIVSGEVDWEEGGVFSIIVMATDMGTPPLSAEAELMIIIEDVNDQYPTFVPQSLNLTIMENSLPGNTTEVGYVVAIDLDSEGNSSIVTYSVLMDFARNKFELDSETGLVTFVKGTLDRERRSRFDLLIRATDQGSPPLFTDATLIIMVGDSNDFGPVFAQELFVGSVPEASEIGTPILYVIATDDDTGTNANLRYSIPDPSLATYFAINETTGEIYTNGQLLDFETVNVYTFEVRVEDSAPIPRSDTAQVRIHITDSNDHPPIFAQNQYSALIRENLAPGTTILRIIATDIDLEHNAVVTFSLRMTNNSDAFGIDPETGVLYAARYINREETPFFNLTVIANNSEADAILFSEVPVDIGVTDLNDMHPSFEPIISIRVREDEAVNETIFTLTAEDSDEGMNGSVSYTLLQGNEDGVFDLDPGSGSLTLLQGLDFEGTSFYMLAAMAADDGSPSLTSFTNILVQVVNANDHPPQLANNEYFLTVRENAVRGVSLATITAFDRDGDPISYQLSNTTVFNIDTFSGALELAVPSLVPYAGTTHNLTIQASDQNFTTTAWLVIYVQPGSSSSLPSFTQRQYSSSLREDAAVGLTLFEFSGETTNANDYAIISGDPDSLFDINAFGTLSLASTAGLDYETQSLYQLVILITNSASEEAHSFIDISVLDVNEHAPEFISQSFFVAVPETTPPSIAFFAVMATDSDGASPAKDITYTITSSDPLITSRFRINSQTGELVLTRPLNFENGDRSFLVPVSATNQGTTPRLSSQVTVEIEVLNGNSFDPIFDQQTYFVELTELPSVESTIGINVVNVSASDRDLGSSGIITYGLNGDHRYFDFRIDTFTGAIFINADIDFERHNLYTLEAVASDGGNPNRIAIASVRIQILDLNDNSPIWKQDQYSAVVIENATIGTFVIQVSASDADQVDSAIVNGDLIFYNRNGYVTYSITQGDPDDHFDIDPDTGVVSIASNLDRELYADYNLTLNATDGGGIYANAYLDVRVIDINDESPVFSQNPYITGLPEDAKNGTHVITVTATDTDLYQNSDFVYMFADSIFELLDSTATFFINDTTGEIFLEQLIDREDISVYNLTVIAIDMGAIPLTGYVTVLVNILDINEFPPDFTVEEFTGEIYENEPRGTFILSVNSTDPDFGENSTVQYLIIEGNELGLFEIEATTGDIIVGNPIDFEQGEVYTLVVMATDSGQLEIRLTNETNITIFILDRNDNVPFFTEERYSASIPEDSNPGDFILLVNATDADSGTNAQFIFTLDFLGDPETERNFVIDPLTGEITLSSTRSLDRERVTFYEFVVNVTDLGSPTLSSSVPVTIEIADINDNVPQFTAPNFEGSLDENLPAGTPVANVSATDEDIELNAEIVYTILGAVHDQADCISSCGTQSFCLSLPPPSSSLDIPFFIDPQDGIISTLAPLDRENTSRHVVLVEARDSALNGTQLSNTTCVHVIVLDQNDEYPTFSQSVYTANISEYALGGEPVASLFARDSDISSNAAIMFSLVSETGSFTIHPTRGDIFTLSNNFDREIRDRYNIIVMATDGGDSPLSSNATVIVTILDENDSPPVFSETEYFSSIFENLAAGTSVLRVNTSDMDIGSNAAILFSIVASSPATHFTVDPPSGIISTTQPLDRESINAYVLTVMATDGGVPQNSASTQVMIEVLDTNDHPPQFINIPYLGSIIENTIFVEPILNVTAQDRDIGENSEVFFSIASVAPSSNAFMINETSGELYLLGMVDTEYSLEYRIEVIASNDLATPNQSSRVNVTVAIGDLNDNIPQFEQLDYNIPYSEANPIGSRVIQLIASDEDATNTNSELTFEIIGGFNTSLFSIDSTSGVVYVADTLDRENEPMHVLEITVSDNGSPPLNTTTTLTVALVDANDNQPIFEQSFYSFSIAENVPMATSVGRVRANDLDLQEVTYFSPDSIYFIVNSTSGEILTAAGELDRETQQLFSFTIVATDGDLAMERISEVMVNVSLLDLNDVTPSFSNGTYYMDWEEDTPIGSVLLIVEAEDFDLGENGTIEFIILPGNDSHFFSINLTSGEIVLEMEFDREMQDLFAITVIAEDQGEPSLTGSAEVIISILDVNDNIPQLNATSYSAVVDEDTAVGTQIVFTGATDRDIDKNSDISFSLSDDFNGTFVIGEDNGTVVLSKSLDYEMAQSYTFSVIAEDAGNSSLSNSSQIFVQIVDLNDNPPIFDSEIYRVTIPENSILHSLVFQAQATDADSTSNGALRYSILAGNLRSVFSIDEAFGGVFMADYLDREITSDYYLSLRVVDLGTPQFTARTELEITVLDINDHSPQFSSKTYLVYIPESTEIGMEFFTAIASDQDIGSNADLTYSIIAGDSNETFIIDSFTGKVRVSRPLDFEITPTYTLILMVSDNGTASQLTDTATLSISITDINEHPPVFPMNTYYINVSDNEVVGTPLGYFIAQDGDIYADSQLTYSLINDSLLFGVDELEGTLFVSSPLVPGVYALSLQVTDGVHVTDTAVHVTVHPLPAAATLQLFQPPAFHFRISESAPSGFIIGELNIEEAEIVQNSSSENIFEINSQGQIILAGVLDYEFSSVYVLNVLNYGENYTSVYAIMTILIQDINDYPPQFTSMDYFLTVSELVDVGSLLLRVGAYDSDSLRENTEFQFSLTSEEGGGLLDNFFLDPSTGELFVVQSLDYETQNVYIFTVNVSNHLALPMLQSSAQIYVQLQDENDNDPRLSEPFYRIQILESAPIGTEILTLEASDADTGSNADLVFSILHINVPLLFKINQTSGAIATNSTFNVEEDTTSSYVISVAVSDRGSPQPRIDTALVFVEVLPDNMYLPEFIPPEGYAVTIPETLPVGRIVLQISAYDPDFPNDTLSVEFSILSGDPEGKFDIDPLTGLISLASGLDFDEEAYYSLTIQASDYGSPSQSSLTLVNVTIQDINNHNPEFDLPVYTFPIFENMPIGSRLFQVSATDPDTVNITYQITVNAYDANNAQLFSIDATSRYIHTAAPIDREYANELEIVVSAIDSGYPTRRSSSQIATFPVIDLNDNPPIFDQSEFVLPVVRLLGSAQFAGIVPASDADVVSQNLQYNIIKDGSNGLFIINSTTAELTTTSQVPETVSSYDLMVNVFDGFFNANVSVTIQLIDDGDFCNDVGFCTSVREVNCTFDIFPYVECNPYCLGQYDLSLARRVCISYSCLDSSLIPCIALSQCQPTNMACDGVCPQGMSVCPTTNICHVTTLSQSCDLTNKTCLIGQTLVQQANGSRYCINSSLLSSVGEMCSDQGFVFCEALDECQNISIPLLCQPCPSGLLYCERTNSCIANAVECCEANSYYCEVLGLCITTGLRCELPNIAPVASSQLIHIKSVVDFDPDPVYSFQGHVIAQLLGNGTHAAVDSQGEQVSIAIVQISPVPVDQGEWQYSLCGTEDFTCLASTSNWERIEGDLLSQSNALVLPNLAHIRFVRRSLELAGAVWLRVKLWDGNEDGYVSPSNDLVSRASPQHLDTLPCMNNGAFSENTTLLTILVHPYIQPPIFNSQASFQFTSILEDTVFAYNYGNTVSDIVASVNVPDLNPIPEGITQGFSNTEDEQLLPFEVRHSYLTDVKRANSVRFQRQAARLSGQLPGVALSLNLSDSPSGKWQVSLSGDPKRFISLMSLIDPSTQLLLLNTTAGLRFLPEENFCGTVSILLGAWDGFWNDSVATQLDNGYIILPLSPASPSLSHYNLNTWEEVWISVSCVADKPIILDERVLLDPIPYRLAYRYERLFTALVAREFASVRRERETLANYLHLVLRVSVTINRVSKALGDRSYVSFSVDNDELSFSEISQLITERQSVLACLDFEIIELSQDASYGPGAGCPGDDPQHYHGVHINSFISQFSFDGDDDFLGVAVVGVSTLPSQGVWQYHRGNWLMNQDLSSEYNPNSSIWVNFPHDFVASETSALLFHGNDRIRFIPNPDHFWNSATSINIPSLRIKLWDSTLGNITQLSEVSTMNINTNPFEDTLQSLTSPIGLFSDDVMTIEASRFGCDHIVNSGSIHDACCVCDGSGGACAGCDGVSGRNVLYDSCDQCGRRSTTCLGCDFIPFSGTEQGLCSICITTISLPTGDATPSLLYPHSTFVDCNARCYGEALNDSCGVCSGGNTGHVFDSDRDCAGVCFGEALIDDCGDCSGPNTLLSFNQNMDCTGVCYGPYQSDSCGICQEPDQRGQIFENRDCNSTCFGVAALDNCGVCYGEGTGTLVDSTLDACGVCAGDNSTCVGCDGEVASGVEVDSCGECGGNGCGCFRIDTITPNAGPRTGGTEVVIKGAGLFLNDTSGLGFTFDRNAPNCGAPYRFPITGASIQITCLFREANSGEQRQAFAIPVNQTTIRCITESTTLESREFFVQVRVANGRFSNPIPFYYDDYSVIRVDRLSPASTLIQDISATLDFIGSNFLNTSAAACLIYNFQMCIPESSPISDPHPVPAIFLNSSQYSCQVPEAAVPCHITVRLSLDGQESGNLESTSTNFSFTYRHSAPQVLDVFFSRDLSNLIIDFDRSVRLANSAPPQCMNIFNEETFNLIGGFNATCEWTDNRRRGLTISLPMDANVVINSPIVFEYGAIETNGTQFSFAIPSTTVHIVSDHNAVQPIAVIDGPSSIPTCGEFTYSAIHSQFPGYKDFEYEWSIYVEDVSILNNFNLILDYIDNLGTNANSIILDSTYFLPNIAYYMQLSVVNSVGVRSETKTLNLTKDTSVQPQLHILGSEELRIYYGEDATLQAQVFLPECFNSIGQNTFEYSWRLMKIVDERRNTLEEQSLASVHTLSSLVVLPSHLFEQNTSYTVWLTATVNGQTTNTDEVALRVLSPDVAAVIVGGNRTVAQHRIIVLDARNSTIIPSLPAPEFTWACDVIGSQNACYNQSNTSFPVPIRIPKTNFVTIPAADLAPGQFYRFTLTLEQGDIISTASVVIETAQTSAPIVEIVDDASIVLATQEVWLEGIVYSSLPLERAYWESLQLGEGFLDLGDKNIIQSQTIYPSPDTLTTTSSPIMSSPVTTVTTDQANRVNLVIPPNTLQPGLKYTFRLTAVSRDGESAYAEISITASSPPQSLRLVVTPTFGVAIETSYTLTASGGVDEPVDTPLLYQFGFVKIGTKDNSLASPVSDSVIYWLSGIQVSTSIDTFLPSGDPALNYSLTLVIRAFDRDGSFTDALTKAIIEPLDVSSNSLQYYSNVLTNLEQSLSASKKWSEVLSRLSSVLSEINKHEHLRSTNLKSHSLRLLLNILDNHLPPAATHYVHVADLLEQITAYSGIPSSGSQNGVIRAVDTIIEWFRSETRLIETSAASAQGQGSSEPLLLRTTYQSSAPPAFSETTATSLTNVYLNMLEGGSLANIEENFVQTLEKLSTVLCQESTTGKKASTSDTHIVQSFVKISVPSGLFNISGILVNFMDSASTSYQSVACTSTATPCEESCISGFVFSNSSGLLTRFVDVNMNGNLMLDASSQQKLVTEIEGSNPNGIKLFSDVFSVKVSIPIQQIFLPIQNLNSPVQILIPVQNPIPNMESQPLCLYRELGGSGGFDPENYLWKLDVTTTPEIAKIGSRMYYICKFNHLSEFAIGLLPPPVITEPPPTTTSSPTTPPTTMATTTPPLTTAPPSVEPVPFPAAAVVIPIILILIIVAVTVVLLVVFLLWRKNRRGKLKIAPLDTSKQEKEKEPKAKLVKAGPLTPEESKIPMQIILCKGDGKERSRVGSLNVLPSIRLRELRYQLSDNFPSLKEKKFYFLTRQLCDIEPAAEQQQFVSLVFGEKPIFVREVGAENEQTRKHFCICGNAAVFECSNCSSQGYCSPECQAKHWTEQHQKDCTKLSEKRKRSDILQRRLSVGEESQRRVSIGATTTPGPLSPTTPMNFTGPSSSQLPGRSVSLSGQRVSLSSLASQQSSVSAGDKAELTTDSTIRAPATLGPQTRVPANIATAQRRQLPALSRSASLQYSQQPAGLQQAGGGGGFLTPQGLPSRSSIVTSTPFPGQNLSSLPFTPGRPSLQSPLHQPVQPLFTQPTALRQISTRPLAPAGHLSNIRNEPLLESDEDDYETSSDGSKSKSPSHSTKRDGELDKAKTVAAVSMGQPVTTPPQLGGGDEPSTSRPPSLAIRKKRGSASVQQSAEKSVESSSSDDDDDSSSDSESQSGSSSGSGSSSEGET